MGTHADAVSTDRSLCGALTIATRGRGERIPSANEIKMALDFGDHLTKIRKLTKE